MITGLHHASLLVADTRVALKFYCDLLGLAQAPRPDLGFPGAWLALADGRQIHLLELPNPDPSTGRPPHGGRDRHLALLTASLDELQERFEQASIPFTRSRSSREALFVRDPDGNAIELMAVPPRLAEEGA